MAQASDLDKFVDFALTTREAVLTGPDVLVSQASNYREHLIGMMLNGLTPEMYIQDGKKIVDFVQLAYTSTFSHYDVTDDFTFTAEDSLTELELPWRFSKVHTVINEAEVDLQGGDRSTVFKRVKRAKESARDLSWWEGMEDALWATPDYENMESPTKSGTGRPYSLRCFITDDGGAPSSTNGGVTGADFPTVMTVNPTTYPKWKNQVATFTNTNDASRVADSGGVLSAMNRMWLLCQFRSPSNSQEYISDTKLNKLRIVSNTPSQELLVRLATSKNNVLSPKNDIGWASGQVVYHGIPTMRVNKLDNIDTDVANNPGDVATASDGTGTKGFRFRYLNFNHIVPIFHKKHYRRLRPFDGGANQPHAKLLFEDTWHQLWCKNRREQGIVRPA